MVSHLECSLYVNCSMHTHTWQVYIRPQPYVYIYVCAYVFTYVYTHVFTHVYRHGAGGGEERILTQN